MTPTMRIHSILIAATLMVSIVSGPLSAQEETAPPLPITPPVLKTAVQAKYPEKAAAEGITASVIMEIDIDETGAVEGVSVVTPATPAGYGFDEAAVEAANLFEFEPAKEGDVPIPVRITYRYEFTISVPVEPDSNSVKKDIAPEVTADKKPKRVVNFTGQLKERGTRLPLSGVTITIFRGEGNLAVGYEAITDADGKFEFANLDADDWMILAEPTGYFPLKTTEKVEKGKRTEAVFYIEKSDYNPYDVTVEGDQIKKEVNRTTLEVKEIEKIPGTFGDVLAVVQNLPGVARTSPVSGQIVVRGSSPEDTLVFVDGVEVPIIYHFGGLRSVIPLGMLDKLDFYPGNFTSEFGRATGGVVDVGVKKLNPEKVGGYADVNLIDAGVYVEAPIGDKFAIAVAARRSYVDAILKGVVPDSANVNLISAPRYYDYQLLASYHPSQKHELQAFIFGSDDELEILFDNPADISPDLTANNASTSTTFYRTVLSYTFSPNDTFQNTFKTSAGRNWVYFGLGDQVYLDINSYVSQIYNSSRINLSKNIAVVAGVDYIFSTTDARIKFPPLGKEGEPGAKPDFDNVQFTSQEGDMENSVGSFLQIEGRFFNRLSLIPGVRFDYFSRVDDVSLAPRFNARLDIAKQWTAKAGVGLYHKEPSFDETDEVFGNPDLGLESAMHYSVGVEYKPLEFLMVDVTGFYKTMDGLVTRTDETVTRNGVTSPLNYSNEGQGKVYGLELLLRHDFANNFTGWISYTLSQAERKDSPDEPWRDFDFNQSNILTILGTYNLPRNWSIGGRWRLVSGNPTTPRVGSVYVADDGLYEPVFGTPNSEQLPPFHQLDIRVDKRWVYQYWMLTAYLDVQNIYNSPNTTGYSYNYDSSEKRPQQGLPILPVIGLKGEF